MSHAAGAGTIKGRLKHEMQEYAIVCAYLYICLGALQFYKEQVLAEQGISYFPYGAAAIKALILGKFMMVGHALKLGGRHDGGPLIVPILRRTLAFVALLYLLNVLEDIAAAAIKGRPITDAMAELTGGSLLRPLAMCIVFVVILLPYFAYREVAGALGEGTLRRLLLSGSRSAARGAVSSR